MREPTRTFELLELLSRHGVEFIVVGMTSAVLQGAPALTFDLDIVYLRDEENVTQLLAALGEIGALFRDDPRRIAPNRSHLASPGHKLLDTALGHFDVLGSLDEGVGYAELLPDTTTLDVSGLSVRVLTLKRLIGEKERLGREKTRPSCLYSVPPSLARTHPSSVCDVSPWRAQHAPSRALANPL